MEFNDRVMATLGPDHERRLTVEEYAALPVDERPKWLAGYAKYRTKKVRRYEHCDLGHEHFLGWEPVEIGIGEPTHYYWSGVIMARAVDDLLSSNVLTQRILSRKPTDGGTVKFDRFTGVE